MSPQRVIRPAVRRSPAGVGSLLWTVAAAALPVIVTVLVLTALTLGVLLFSTTGFDSLVAVVAVEWLVVNRVPLSVDAVELGFLPLLPPLVYVAVLARQTRAVLADVEQPGRREAAAAMSGVTVTGLIVTGLASLLVGSAASDFAVREFSVPVALMWTAAIGLVGSGLGVWLFFRRELREILPMWVRGGIHLGVAFVAATWAIVAALVLIGILFAWDPIAASLGIGKGFVGTAALTGISVAYLPNVVMTGAALVVGGEAHLGEASYSVFAVSRGPMPEVPLAAALPTTDPHWVIQGLLLVTVLVAAALARSVAHWFRTTADAVRAAWLAAVVVALVMAVSPVVAGGQLGVLGAVGTGGLIAAVMALLLFGIIGSTTIALSLAGLTRRRERAESELARRRRRVAGTAGPEVEDADAVGTDAGRGVSGDGDGDHDAHSDEVHSNVAHSDVAHSDGTQEGVDDDAEGSIEADPDTDPDTDTDTDPETDVDADAVDAGADVDVDENADTDADADPGAVAVEDADTDADADEGADPEAEESDARAAVRESTEGPDVTTEGRPEEGASDLPDEDDTAGD